MRCPRCGHEMNNVMHFEAGKDFAYHYCTKCQQKTHQKRIHYEAFEKDKKEGNKHELLY